jgi:hypothetical protein
VSDVVFDTARRLGITTKALFRRVAFQKGLTDATADNRFELWFCHGELPQYVSDWCDEQWREPYPLPPEHKDGNLFV